MFKFVVLSALVAVCAGQALPLDTPEVAEAKAAHFAAVEEARARAHGAPIFAPAPSPYYTHAPAPAFPAFPGFAPSPAFAPAPAFPSSLPYRRWDGIPAPIVVSNGQVQDIPEVAAEKAKHLALAAEAAVRSASNPLHPGIFDDGKYRHDPSGEYNPALYGDHAYQVVPAPLAPAFPQSPYLPYQVLPSQHFAPAPVVVANGQVQDTPEVAAAKAAHLAYFRSAGAASL